MLNHGTSQLGYRISVIIFLYPLNTSENQKFYDVFSSGVSRAGFQPLTIITKCSILDVAAAVDPSLFSGCIENNIGLKFVKCVKEIWKEDVNFA